MEPDAVYSMMRERDPSVIERASQKWLRDGRVGASRSLQLSAISIIISRMIKNLRQLVVLSAYLLVGCQAESSETSGWQGVVVFEERTLAFELSGRVAEVRVTEGDDVDANVTLAQLDDTLERLARDAKSAEARAVKARLELIEAGSRLEDIQQVKASIRAADAQLKLAKRTLARERALGAEGVTSEATLDTATTEEAAASARKRELEATLRRLRRGARDEEIAEAAARLDAAEAAVSLGTARLQRHTLQTDHAGVVLAVHVEPDEVVQLGAPVVTLGDVEHPYIDIFVPQAELSEIELGTAMGVTVDARDKPYRGIVEYVGRRTEFTPKYLFSERERANLVVRVRVRIEAPDGDLPAGVPGFAVVDEAAR